MDKLMLYRDLIVWQKAMELVKETYILVKKLPKEETYALSDQMRRAAISIPSNIAEGYGRKSKTEYSRFLILQEVHCLSWKHKYILGLC